MKNETLKSAAKKILIDLLIQCTEGQQRMFKRMYYPSGLDKSIEEAVEQMDSTKIDWAISQTERSIEKNSKQ